MSCDEPVALFKPMRESIIVIESWSYLAAVDMCAFHKRSELYYDVVVKSSRSPSHLLMSFLSTLIVSDLSHSIQR